MKHSSDPSLDYEVDLNFREIAEPILRIARTWVTPAQAKECCAIPDDPVLVEYLVQLDRGQGIELRGFWNRVWARHLKYEIRTLLKAAEAQRAKRLAPQLSRSCYWDPALWDGTPGMDMVPQMDIDRLNRKYEERWGPPKEPETKSTPASHLWDPEDWDGRGVLGTTPKPVMDRLMKQADEMEKRKKRDYWKPEEWDGTWGPVTPEIEESTRRLLRKAEERKQADELWGTQSGITRIRRCGTERQGNRRRNGKRA